MNLDQRLCWIALPAGTSPNGSDLQLSIFLGPRLRGTGDRLQPFVDFLDWPARLRTSVAAFEIEVQGGPVVTADVLSPAPDSALWTLLFDKDTPLQPFEFDNYADRPMVSYPVGVVLAELRDIYVKLAAASPTVVPRLGAEHGSGGAVAALFSNLRSVARSGVGEARNPEELDTRIRRLLDDARALCAARRAAGLPPLTEPNDPLRERQAAASYPWESALLFHRRPRPAVALPADGAAALARFKGEVDFHQLLASFGDHPSLLRRLGLVVDIAVPASALPRSGVAAPLRLRVRPRLLAPLSGATSFVTPWTAYVHDEVEGELLFAAAHRDGRTAPVGLLPLADLGFGLEGVDVDGALLKALNFAITLERADSRGPGERPVQDQAAAGVPALRTSGISLVQQQRAGALQRDFGRAAEVDGAVELDQELTLYAEDLNRGYRMDVQEEQSGVWRSLHEVVTTYAVTAAATGFSSEDEGFSQLSLVGPATPAGQKPDSTAELYIHECTSSWDGWSLSAPRPGKVLSRAARASNAAEPDTQPQRVANSPLTAAGLAIEAEVRSGSLPRLRFGRAYRVRLRDVDLAGNGPDPALADHRTLAGALADRVLPATGFFAYLRFEPVLAPVLMPRVPYGEGASLLRMVVRSDREQSSDAYATWLNGTQAAPASGCPYTGYDDRHLLPPKVDLQTVERHGLFDDVLGPAPSGAAVAAAYELARREKGSLQDIATETVAGYPVASGEQVELPYLPDPWAVGVVFFGLPGGHPKEPFQVRFSGASWHQRTPLRLRLIEGNTGPDWDAGRQLLTIFLPKAKTVTVRVCSLLGADFRKMGIVRWCQQTLAPAEFARLAEAAKSNQFWMTTPWHELVLVHAVQRPLGPPLLSRLGVERSTGELSADLIGALSLEVASSEKVDLVGEWREVSDDVSLAGPSEVEASSVVFSLPLAVAALGDPDANERDMPYSLRDGELRFFTAVKTVALPPLGRHGFGDTKHRRVSYHAVATSRFREYFPQEWAARPGLFSVAGDAVEIDVPSSAPPTAPRVLCVIPTQRWEEAVEAGARVQRRKGGGLRVYLARPWYSSGEGESLGVVVGSYAVAPEDPAYPFVTLIGRDPIRAGEMPAATLPQTLIGPKAIVPSLALLERDAKVAVLAFDVAYDAETQRWFCDLQLDTGEAYMPFVRLALVRYQANSLQGCAISRVALADLVQTLPDRALTLRAGTATSEIEIEVTGPTYRALKQGGQLRNDTPALGRCFAVLEQREPKIADEVLAWQPLEGTVTELAPTLSGSVVSYRGKLVVAPVAGRAVRIAVREYDHVATDPSLNVSDGVARRLVYADVVALDALPSE